ncbi:hypothetical protein [Nonomuraea sp. NPDC002799]
MGAETVIAISATVIAIASLAVSVHQLRATRLHNRHMIRPLLQLTVTFSPGRAAGLMLVNSGLGPAIVTGTRIWLDDQIAGTWTKETSRRVRGDMAPHVHATTVADGAGLPIGYTNWLLSVDAYSMSEHDAFRDLVEQRFDIEIRYESLYGGEDFVVTTRSSTWRAATARPFGPPRPQEAEKPIAAELPRASGGDRTISDNGRERVASADVGVGVCDVRDPPGPATKLTRDE